MVHRPFEHARPSGTRKPLGEDERRLASEAGRLPLNCGRGGRAVHKDLDAFIQLSQKRGAEVIYTFGRTPRWASSKPDAAGPYGPDQCAPPADLQYWDDYVTAIASHAGVRISYCELWNEPQDSEFYCGDMHTIVAMAQHAYRIIKSINPAAQELTPTCTASGGPAWLDSYLSEGGGNYADIMSFHGYSNA
jgi:hypothetical protein